jgi:ABC-type Zn uptake system ZnuABC Zn-binding protein ZnuA
MTGGVCVFFGIATRLQIGSSALLSGMKWRSLLALSVVFTMTLQASGPPRVMVSLPSLVSWTVNIADTNAAVEAILPPELGPHGYQLNLKDLQRLRQADLLVLNGLGVDDWILEAVRRTTGQGKLPEVVRITDGLKVALLGAEHGAPANPHVWLDPSLAKLALFKIQDGLTRVDPEHARRYADNAAAYGIRLDRLDQELQQGLAGITNRNLATYHDAFPYFARRYGFRVVAVLEEQPNIEPPPRHVVDVMNAIRSYFVPVIFVEPQYNGRLALQMAQDLGIKVATLDVLETGASSPDYYETAMRRNLAVLQENLR